MVNAIDLYTLDARVLGVPRLGYDPPGSGYDPPSPRNLARIALKQSTLSSSRTSPAQSPIHPKVVKMAVEYRVFESCQLCLGFAWTVSELCVDESCFPHLLPK